MKASVRFDTTALVAAIDCLAALMPQLSDRLAEAVQGFFGAVEAGEQALFVQREGVAAAGAGDVVVFLDPSQGLLDLVATVGAGDA